MFTMQEILLPIRMCHSSAKDVNSKRFHLPFPRALCQAKWGCRAICYLVLHLIAEAQAFVGHLCNAYYVTAFQILVYNGIGEGTLVMTFAYK